MKIYWALCLLFVQITNTTEAQGLPGITDSIYSQILKEKRFVQVLLPENYKPGNSEKYDVVYLLDGNENIKLMSQIQQFAKAEGYISSVIIVGISNTARNRDLTPTPVKEFTTSGGAANFLSFLKKELMPHVDKTYPTNGENILYGHSFGGLFAMYALLTEPQLFSSYLAVDPSFWWDDEYIVKLATEKLKEVTEKTLYISGRDGHYREMGIDKMELTLKQKAPEGLFWKVVAYSEETHNSIKFKSMYDGLKLAYGGYKNQSETIQCHPMNGVVLKNKPFTIFCFSDLPAIRYTTDGTVPTLASAKMEKENSFSGSTILNIKSFTPKGKYNKESKNYFVLGKALKPIPKSENFKPGGFSYSYYEGKWDSIPDFKNLKAVESGFTDKDFTFHKLPSKTNFACLFEGRLEIKEEGYYIFIIEADDGAKLYLKDSLLIDYNGSHSDKKSQTYLLPLKKGFYPIRLEYFQKEGSMDLRLGYFTPGSKEPIPIPAEIQYSRK